MARMVDADALAKAMGVYTYMQTEWTPATAWGVPIVDAVPVVRCKDCKHNYHNMIPSGEAEYGCTKCIELPITTDFYCAWGERREDEWQEPEINPCRGCDDYDGQGGCKSNGGCGAKMFEEDLT